MPTDGYRPPGGLIEDDEPRPGRRAAVSPVVLVGALFAALYAIGWLATQYEGSGDTATELVPESTTTTTAAETTTTTSPEVEVESSTSSSTSTTTTEAPRSTVAEAPPTVSELIDRDPRFSQFAAALAETGLVGELGGDTAITVLAPTDAAFAALDSAARGLLADDPEILNATVRHHLIESSTTSGELTSRDTITSLAGEQIAIESDSGSILLDGVATVSEGDLAALDGVVHVIDYVLLPPNASIRVIEAQISSLITVEPILFDDSSAAISAASLATLDRVAEMIISEPESRFEVSGHTDNIGPSDGNQRLSERRARAVVDHLVSQGVEADRLVAVGYGQERPIADNTTADGRAQNRRIELRALTS